jgi:hypothetical protein
MSKIKLISLIAILLLTGGLLSGCLAKPSETVPAGEVNTLEDTAIQTETEAPAETTAPKVDETAIDNELKNLDTELSAIETTGFEADNLSDKDLGL